MIKIEMEFATGKEARQVLEDLLGLNGQTTVSFDQLTQQTVKAHSIPMQIVGDGESTVAEIVEQAKPKRRSKAEIEADKAAAVIENVQGAVEEQLKPTIETTESPSEESTTVTKEDLQKKAVELGRVGKKELCRTVLQKHGADSISTADKNPLKVELYATVLDEFNKL